MDPARLDDCVEAAADRLRALDVPAPQVLLLLGTGLGTLPGALAGQRRTALAGVPGVPPIWSEAVVVSGRLNGVPAWLVEDAPGDLEFGEGGGPASSPWERAFPVWLAAAAGAHLCVLTAAGGSLADDLAPGALAVASDHLNLSGTTPLAGLGETRLGPLFPDQSFLHHRGLRAIALDRARSRGIPLSERVVACVGGPALTTPAERRWYRTAGGELFVQGFAGPLLACAHAGLATLALVAITDAGDEPLRMAELVERAERCAPALEDLVLAMTDDLSAVAREMEEELA